MKMGNVRIVLIFLIFIFRRSSGEDSGVLDLLSKYPDLSKFTEVLKNSLVAKNLGRRSVTILAVPNENFDSRSECLTSSNSGNVFSNHVLLEYLSPEDLTQITPSGRVVATLYQTSGRADNAVGAVNITAENGVVSVRSAAEDAILDVAIIRNVTSVEHKFSIFTVDSLLVPCGFDLTATDSQPVVNITDALISGHDFMIAAGLWESSGAARECEERETGAGITLLVPTDKAFQNLPPAVGFRSLPAGSKLQVLKFHVLNSYYPMGSLESIVNPVQPTLATEIGGAESYTLNISRVNGSVLINTGFVESTITQTVFDQKPVVIFGISDVLLPRDMFSDPAMFTGQTQITPSPPLPDHRPRSSDPSGTERDVCLSFLLSFLFIFMRFL